MNPPRGRPPLGCTWNYELGRWDKLDGSVRVKTSKPSTPRGFVTRLAPPPPLQHAARAAPRPPPQSVQPKEPEAQRVIEPSNHERDHALWCASSLPPDVPVYYMNAEGMMVQLGKEPKRGGPREMPTHPKRLRRVNVKVCGPDDGRKLEAGEWEIEERVVRM